MKDKNAITKIAGKVDEIQECLTEIALDWSDPRGWLRRANVALNTIREIIKEEEE
jgi:hypothetical protein